MDKYNYMIVKEGNTYKLEKHSTVPVSCRKVIRGTDLSKHSTIQKYIEILHQYILILARYTTVEHISIKSEVLIPAGLREAERTKQ